MGHVKFLALLLIASVASAGPTYYEKTTVPPGSAVYVTGYGAKCDGSTDDSTALAAALAAGTSTGKRVIIPAGVNCSYATSLTLSSNLWIEGYGSKLTYTGTDYAITTPATGATNYAGVRGLTISLSSASAGALRLGSSFHGTYRDLVIVGTAGTSNIAILMDVNTTGTTNPGGTLNTSQNSIDNVMVNVQVGTAVKFVGADSSHVVTDNTFHNFKSGSGGKVIVTGLYFSKWADSNSFSGMTLIQLDGTTPANGICLSMGQDGAGVYSETFDHIACDTFLAPATDNRQGIIASTNDVVNVWIGEFEFGPQPGAGAYPSATTNHLLKSTVNVSSNTTTITQTAYMGGQLVLGSPVIPATSAWLQNGILLSGPDYTATDSSSSGTVASEVMSHFGQPTLAASSATTVTNLANLLVDAPVAGTNVTATNRYSIQTGSGGGIYSPASNSLFAGSITLGPVFINNSGSTDTNIHGGGSGTLTFGNASATWNNNFSTIGGTGWAHLPALTASSYTTPGQITSTLATGTAPLVIASTTNVANLNASLLGGATFAAPASIGSGTPGTGAFTTLSATGAITSTLATGTAPFTVASTTNVANLNASTLGGATFASPGAIGGTAASAITGTTVTGSSLVSTGPVTAATKYVKGVTTICDVSAASPTTHTGDSNEFNLANCTIPAGTMGTQGQLRINALWSRTATTTNTETYKIRISTTQADTSGGGFSLNTTNATSGVVNFASWSSMRNTDASHQLYPGTVSQISPFTTTTTAVTTGTIDTSASIVYVNFNCVNTTSTADTCGIYSYSVELILP